MWYVIDIALGDLDAFKISAGRNNNSIVMTEQRGSVRKKSLTFLWRFEREIKQRNGSSVIRGKKGEDDASSPLA